MTVRSPTTPAPTGYQVGIPPGWLAFNPGRRSPRSAGLAPVDADLAAVHGAPDGPGVRLVAKMRGTADGTPFEAAMTVGVYRFREGSNPETLQAAIGSSPSEGSAMVIDLPVGPTARWTLDHDVAARPEPVVVAEFYVPVPGSALGEVAVLTFSRRGAAANAVTIGADAIAETFGFTFDGKTPLGPVLFWVGQVLGGGSRARRGRAW